MQKNELRTLADKAAEALADTWAGRGGHTAAILALWDAPESGARNLMLNAIVAEHSTKQEWESRALAGLAAAARDWRLGLGALSLTALLAEGGVA